MGIRIVIDNSGDSRFEFDPADEDAVAKATERFKELTSLGYTAAEMTASCRSRKVTEFDPTGQALTVGPPKPSL
jgi:hypothetical protein